MKKIVNPVTCEVDGREVPAYVEIDWDGKRLSISGVIGPKRNGDAWGSCGQCGEEIRTGKPAEGWTPDMVGKFCDIWERWHLNDMRPYCEHQRDLGWQELAREKITLYHYKLKPGVFQERRSAENAAINALKAGKTFTPTAQQVFLANLGLSLHTYTPLAGELADYYEPEKKKNYNCGSEEIKTRDLVRFDVDERGLLCKPCPVCGYRYGTSWVFEKAPEEVIEWLLALPDTKETPAWV